MTFHSSPFQNYGYEIIAFNNQSSYLITVNVIQRAKYKARDLVSLER